MEQLTKLHASTVQFGLEFWYIVSVWYFTYPTFPIPLVGEGAGETGMKSILFGEKDFSDLSKSLSLCEYKFSDLTLAQDITLKSKVQPSNGKSLGQKHKVAKADKLKFFLNYFHSYFLSFP